MSKDDWKTLLGTIISVYNEKEFDDTKSSSNVWKSAYKFLGQTSNKAPTQLSDGGDTINSPKLMAAKFNEIFVSKVKKIRDKANLIPAKMNPIQRLRSWLSMRETPLPNFEIRPVSRKQLRKTIKKMKGGCSHGLDYIDSYSLKISYPLIEDAIFHLVNLSIKEKIFAEAWKIQLVMPLHKKGDKLLGSNYRPVSHIVEVGKIVEYVIYDQVYTHFVENNIFHPNHHP